MPLERKQSIVAHLPNRSPSIMDVLTAVQKQQQPAGNHQQNQQNQPDGSSQSIIGRASPIVKPAPLDTFVFGDGHAGGAEKKSDGHAKRKDGGRSSQPRPLAKTPQPLDPAALRRNPADDKVVMFPKELRANRFFNSPELSAKATKFVLEGRRPSSIFSAISDNCRQELELLQRVQQIQLGTREDIASPGNSPKSPLAGRSSSMSLGQQQQQVAASMLLGAWQSDAHYLRHIEEQEREALPALEKLGRRLEYGKVLGMYREELISSKSTGKYQSVPRHKEVGGSKAPCPAPPLDWSHMGISDVPSLIDIQPRTGKSFQTSYAIAKEKQQELERQKRRQQQQQDDHAPPNAAKPSAGDVKATATGGKPPTNGPQASSSPSVPIPPQPNHITTNPLVGYVTSGPSAALLPVPSTSRYENLRYCFGDKDAEKLLPSSMVIIKTKDTTYAFTEGRRRRGIEGLMTKGGSLVAADGTIDINSCLQCMNQYEAAILNLSWNSIDRLDRLLANTLATLLRTSLVKLDLSFNKIRFVEPDFFGGNSSSAHLTPQQLKHHIAATADKVARLQDELANEPETASLAEKRKEFFRRVRLVALTDLADPEAPNRLLFHSLRALHLHGNPLDSFEEVMKLTPLAGTLQSLTFHGNDALDREAAKEKNRRRLLAAFPSLVSLNFTTIVASDEEELSVL